MNDSDNAIPGRDVWSIFFNLNSIHYRADASRPKPKAMATTPKITSKILF